jgi:hypothetical protein
MNQPMLIATPHPDFNFDNDHINSSYGHYRALWASVLLQAIRDLDSSDTSEKHKAREYVWTDQRCNEGSFDWICTMLDLDRERLRTLAMTRDGRIRIGGKNQGNHVPRTRKHSPQDSDHADFSSISELCALGLDA